MATFELDPLFVKALKLLHSKNKDSADQLKQLLDDVIAQRKGETIKKEGKDGDKSSSSSGRHSIKTDEEKKREAEKRTFEKVKQDLSDLTSQSKKPRLDVNKDVKEDKSKSREKEKAKEKDREKEKEREREKERREREKEVKEKEKKEREAEKREQEKKVKAEVTVISSDSDDSKSLDADDFAFDMGLACIVCRSFDVSSGNTLVECQECHNLYHQDCHRPPITEQDVNDPRFVWYCSRCAKTLKKMVTVKSSKQKPVFTSGVKDSGNSSKQVKSEPQALFQFRRTEPLKTSTTRDNSSTSSRPLSGLASLAANLSGKTFADSTKSKSDSSRHGPSKSDTSKPASSSKPEQQRISVSSAGKSDQSERSTSLSHGSKLSGKSSAGSHKLGSSSGGAVSVMNADKRLQMMKKKAAAKQMKSMK